MSDNAKTDELDILRSFIDETDAELLRLFLGRMKIAEKIADHKAKNALPILNKDREDELLADRVGKAPEEFKSGVSLFFTDIMDISKCVQEKSAVRAAPFFLKAAPFTVPENPKTACQGVVGSYSEQAGRKLFGAGADFVFTESFEDVFRALDKGEVDYGVLPIENSSAGEVSLTYELMSRYSFYIHGCARVKADHTVAALPGARLGEIKSVVSHEQALRQCSRFVQGLGAAPRMSENTAFAARTVAESGDTSLAAVCSAECAARYGLEILADNITDREDNHTRFISVAKTPQISPQADIISISLSTPHSPGALYRILTRFAFYGLNLLKIESKPVPYDVSHSIKRDVFDVIFFLDFNGNVRDEAVRTLLTNLNDELRYFRFLGNYSELL
ncbi:MAG: chorismate mutase [Oscillospiraceae bacterium]|jgi:chorismate mutase/prephenate dehydratase|nr:chorismate mutase [Oscillospiraceae bacterium]